ncbi:MAG TPA: hypothetical protein VJC05_01845, partial [Candidatus Andersenbacteria bacterium]|nr:hypothetical protein [Candidatus Andersenbacteria bacterium]
MAEEKPPEDLNLMRRRLYAREEPAEVTRREEELHRLGLKRQSLPAPDPAETLLGARYKNLAVLRAKRMGRLLRFSGLLALVLVIAIVAVTLTVVYRATQTVSEAQVNVSLAAPAEFTSGSEITYVVRYTNESRVDWTQVELILTPPRGFTWRDSNREVEHQGRQVIAKVGDVASGQGGDLQVRGQLIGEQNETAVASAEIFLTPANYPSGRFSKQAVLATAITALPLDVSLDIAGDAASGERVLATINVRNLS